MSGMLNGNLAAAMLSAIELTKDIKQLASIRTLDYHLWLKYLPLFPGIGKS